VHPTATGAVELGRFIVAAVTALPPVPGTSAPPSTTVSCTVTTSTTVTSTTVAPGSTAPAFTNPAGALQRARRCAFR